MQVAQVGLELGAVVGAAQRVVDARRRLAERIHRVVHQVALGAAGFLAQQAHRFELVQQIARRLVDVQHAVDRSSCAAMLSLLGRHQLGQRRVTRHVVAHAQRLYAGRQARRVGDRLDQLAIDVDARLEAPQ